MASSGSSGTPSSSSGQAVVKKKKREEEDSSIPALISRIATAAEATSSRPVVASENHIDAFGAFVVRTLKRLPETTCDDAIFEITDILKAKLKDKS